MKNLIAVGALMLGLGFAIGWIAKPVPLVRESDAVVSTVKKSPGTSAAPAADPIIQGKRSEREAITPKKPSNMPTEEQMSQAKKMQGEMAKQMVKRYRERFEKQIDKLAENLHLTAAQKAGLSTWLDEKMAKLESADFTDAKAMADIADIGKELSNKALEDQLAPTLTAEQKTALVEFKTKERAGKVDTLALKGITKLQGVIEFEDGQRDEVYKLLSQDAENTINAEDETPDPTSVFTEGMGIEMDPYGLGLQKAMTESIGDPSKLGQGGDQKEMAKQLRTAFDKRIEAKVELLRPVLNDKQLDQYRTELKSKGMGVYGPMLMSLEASDGK